MDFQPIVRTKDSFQQSLQAVDVTRIFQAVFGTRTSVVSAVELGSGMYNNTYRVILDNHESPYILRVAPEAQRQYVSEKELMRNEYALWPYLAPLNTICRAL